jgi:type IV pilus assembly protein PilN
MIATTINLMPWREERRKQQQQDFLILLGVAAALGALVWWVWTSTVSAQIDNQQGRNSYIEKELALLDSQIKEIKELETRRAELVARMDTIQKLQNDRPSIVYIFDQIARTVPDGVFYTDIERQGVNFTIKGVAESNTRISALMRSLNESPWFQDPSLQTVNAVADSEASSFVLTVTQEAQESAQDKAADNKAGGAKK